MRTCACAAHDTAGAIRIFIAGIVLIERHVALHGELWHIRAIGCACGGDIYAKDVVVTRWKVSETRIESEI